MLPAHAPPEFQDRSTLWNSVEEIEKSSDAQLAREIEVALPVELSRAEQLALVRSFVKDNFVADGMCADFALHDKGDGNPHAHIMLTIRPLKPDGRWGPKCRKVYELDSQGNRIPDGKGGWKNHREDTTDWNNRENAEKWRAAWAAYANRALEAAGRPERIDHRSYKRQGVDKIPSIHMGVAASQMERRGIATEKGDINRQIAADNKLLKELKARITRIYNWSKDLHSGLHHQKADPQCGTAPHVPEAEQSRGHRQPGHLLRRQVGVRPEERGPGPQPEAGSHGPLLLQRQVRPHRAAGVRRVRHPLPPVRVDEAGREIRRVALRQPGGLRHEILPQLSHASGRLLAGRHPRRGQRRYEPA